MSGFWYGTISEKTDLMDLLHQIFHGFAKDFITDFLI